jgi:hypothetical protein
MATIALAVLLVGPSWAQAPNSTSESPSPPPEQWSFSFNLSAYIVPKDRSYASPTFSADKQRFHFGARYNYEDKETGSLWLGYNFEVGDKLALQATPMIGGVFGHTTGIAPGYQVSLNWKKLELFTEGEFVFDTKESAGSFFYSWMELSYAPLEWCRAGLVAQRTKAYHTSLDIQRGLLIGVSHKQMDFTTYIFNAGWTAPTVVLSLGLKF